MAYDTFHYVTQNGKNFFGSSWYAGFPGEWESKWEKQKLFPFRRFVRDSQNRFASLSEALSFVRPKLSPDQRDLLDSVIQHSDEYLRARSRTEKVALMNGMHVEEYYTPMAQEAKEFYGA